VHSCQNAGKWVTSAVDKAVPPRVQPVIKIHLSGRRAEGRLARNAPRAGIRDLFAARVS